MSLGGDPTWQDHVRNLSHSSKPSAVSYPTSSSHLTIEGVGFVSCPPNSLAPAVPGSSGPGHWGTELLKQPSLLSKICPLSFSRDLWAALTGMDRPLPGTKATGRPFLGKGLYSDCCSKTEAERTCEPGNCKSVFLPSSPVLGGDRNILAALRHCFNSEDWKQTPKSPVISNG